MKKIILLLTALLIIPIHTSHATETLEGFYAAGVKDISDRAYEGAVIELLDNASESIVISMYILKPEKKPVELLTQDLVEALDRGVTVTIYLNTKFPNKKPADIIKDKAFRRLEEKGASVYLYNSNNRVHDKLIIVDERYVVEGSPNWSVSALKANYESSTLIDSPRLAIDKLRRLEDIPLDGETKEKPKKEEVLNLIGVLPAGASLDLAKVLLEDKDYFPKMVKAQDDRGMDVYVLLLAESKKLGKQEFEMSLEDMAFTLRLPEDWTGAAKRRQIIKVLRRLKDKYKLIDFEFDHGDDAYIVIRSLPGETFAAGGKIISPEFLTSVTASGQFVALLEELLKDEGTTFDSFSWAELSKRFHVKYTGLRTGREEVSQ